MTTDPFGSSRARDSGATAQPHNLALTFVQGVPVLVLEEQANIEGLRASIRVHLPGHLPSIGGRTVRLDLGEREINLFDLRRVVHLLKQEYGVEVTGLYVRAAVIHRFAERELKLKLFQNNPVDQAAVVPAPAPAPAAGPRSPAAFRARAARREDPELEELATEELEALDDDAPLPAVLLPAPASPRAPSFAAVTLPHDLRPEDVGAEAVLENSASSDSVLRNRATATPMPTPKPVAPPQASIVTSPPVGSNRTQTLHKTLRSGAVVKFDGDVVVFGDVNPGAQIVASGNIAVLGALKGMAHAGCDGDESAFVLAFDLRATQIRIAAKIAVPTGRGQGAEVATVSGDEIVVEPYRAGARKSRPGGSRPAGSTDEVEAPPPTAPRPARLARGR